jgi:hypothetical protein
LGYASCTSGVACSVCPGFSWAILAAASLRSSSYQRHQRQKLLRGGRITRFDVRQDSRDAAHAAPVVKGPMP